MKQKVNINYTLPFLILLLSFSLFINCPGSTDKKDDSTKNLFILSALSSSSKSSSSSSSSSSSTGVGTGTSGSSCSSNSDCNSSTVCVSGYYLNQSTVTSKCTTIPTSSGTISINGAASSGTIASSTPIIDFDITISTTGNYVITMFPTTSTLDSAVQIFDSTGRTSVNSITDSTTAGSRERLLYNFTTAGSYKIRAANYYTSGTFGGGFKIQVANSPSSVSGGGSCNFFSSASGSNCYDFSNGSTFVTGFCSGGTYSAGSSCATVNAGVTPTISGRCLYSPNSSFSNGQGLVVRNYYSAGTGIVSAVNTATGTSDCTTLDSTGSIFQ